MRWLIYVAIPVAILGTSLLAREDKDIAATFYIVEPSILEGDPKGSIEKGTIRTLAQPTVMVREGEGADVDVRASVGAQALPCGVVLKAKVERTNDGKVRVRGMLEKSTAGTPSDDIVVGEVTTVHFAKVVVLGERIRVPISKTANASRWFELLVTTPPPEPQR